MSYDTIQTNQRIDSDRRGPQATATTEPVEIGQCDTPTCANEASEFTPEGYVCSSCAREIEQEFLEAERRDRASREVSR